MKNNPTVLVVEDNRELLSIYVRRLLKEGYNADGFDNVHSALDSFKNKRYDVIVLYLIIPGLEGKEEGGLDVIDHSLSIDPLVQIIVVTAHGTIERFKRTQKEGAVDFIEKKYPEFMEELVDTIKLTLLKRDQKIRQGNPFIPQSNHTPKFFGGRNNEISFLEERLARALRKNSPVNEHFIILGQWGIGKSTLLKKYKEIVNEKGLLGIYIPVVEFTDQNDIRDGVNSIIQGIFREIPFATPKLKKLSGYFQSVGINILGSGLQFATKPQTMQPESILYDTLKGLWEDVQDRKLLLIVMDDVQNFSAILPIFTILRQVLGGTSIKDLRILFGLSCTPSHWKSFTGLSKYSPLSRTFFKKVVLKRLTKEEVKDTIINSLKDTGVIFKEEIIEEVFNYTQGHPFEVQALCQRLFDNQVGGRVDKEVWEKSLQQTSVDMGEYIFEHWYRKMSDRDAFILKILSNADISLRIKDIQHMVLDQDINIDVNSVSDSLNRLINSGLVNYFKDSNELLEIPDKMFKSYIMHSKI